MAIELEFVCRGETFRVNAAGEIMRMDQRQRFSQWLLLGVSMHHWRNGIDITLDAIFKAPERMIGGLVWDRDHGTVRTWGGSYNGRLPRVTAARLVEVD